MIAPVVGQLVIGWLAADLMSGVFHWWQDRLASTELPGLGCWLIEPSRLHHRQPLVFLEGSFAYRNLSTFGFVGAIAAIWLLLLGPSIALVAAAIGGSLTTQVHYWTHRPSAAGRVIRVLQETGIIQSPKHHAGHHRPPQNRRYCSLTDWCNPVLDAIQVWNRAECLLGRA